MRAERLGNWRNAARPNGKPKVLARKGRTGTVWSQITRHAYHPEALEGIFGGSNRHGKTLPHSITYQPDTPPVDVHVQGRSPGSRLTTFVRLPGFNQWHMDLKLIAYSCGGSYGITTSIMNATHRIPIFAF